MEIILIVVVAAVVLVALLLASNFGKNPTRKTDAMLLREYNLHDKRVASLSGMDMVDALERQRPVIVELERRGYDVSKLIGEEISAKLEGRPMDFQRCKKDGHRRAASVVPNGTSGHSRPEG